MTQKQQPEFVLIARGIGITPFRSMVKAMIDTGKFRPAVLFYIVQSGDEILFHDIFDQAEQKGHLKIVYIVGEQMDESHLQTHVENIIKPHYYLSGPQGMVEEYREMLNSLGIDYENIKTDLFTGYDSA